jgi:hypothetical protein
MEIRIASRATVAIGTTEAGGFIDHFVDAFLFDKASRLYEQRPSRFTLSSSHNIGTDRDTIAFLASVFGLTAESKRNLINVPE